MTQLPLTIVAKGGRQFATFPAALVVFVVNNAEQFLLMRRTEEDGWEMPSGALEEGESPLEGVARELREELGSAFRHRPLYPVHTCAFKFDENVTNMLSIGYLVEYLCGAIVPGDDMLGAEFRWVAAAGVPALGKVSVPHDLSLFARALALFRLSRQERNNGTTSESSFGKHNGGNATAGEKTFGGR